jgi:hypothetical protein
MMALRSTGGSSSIHASVAAWSARSPTAIESCPYCRTRASSFSSQHTRPTPGSSCTVHSRSVPIRTTSTRCQTYSPGDQPPGDTGANSGLGRPPSTAASMRTSAFLATSMASRAGVAHEKPHSAHLDVSGCQRIDVYPEFTASPRQPRGGRGRHRMNDVLGTGSGDRSRRSRCPRGSRPRTPHARTRAGRRGRGRAGCTPHRSGSAPSSSRSYGGADHGARLRPGRGARPPGAPPGGSSVAPRFWNASPPVDRSQAMLNRRGQRFRMPGHTERERASSPRSTNAPATRASRLRMVLLARLSLDDSEQRHELA